MLDARDIARYLVRVGFAPELPEESVLLCPLRLQKLLYYCQGWGLALLGEPLFRQPIEAWPTGPVVPDVYRQFVGRSDGITPTEAGEPTEPILQTVAELLEMVWREYAKHTPKELAEMTRAEPAWKEARAGLAPDAESSNALSLETMRAFFAEAARKAVPASKYPMPDPAEVWQAELQLERSGGRGIPMDEVFGRLKARRKSQPTG